ncbi:MAG TPA: lipoyl synthase, partial [Coriobacteriia bacterium]|nr:lipoyl synthase [Coriobacteriia bacterium]
KGTSVERILGELRLDTVCRSARCPNRGECYAGGVATFLILGATCTRSCGFCAVTSGDPAPLDPEEPARVAEAARRMALDHVVVTAVTRDDLPDGGAAQFVAVIEALREAVPAATVEVLTSDFAGDHASVDAVVDARPDVFNHNLETVPRLYGQVRPAADYGRSLAVLARAKKRAATRPHAVLTKSGLILGLGETPDEVVAVMRDLRVAGCDLLTLGQYLRPSDAHLPVAEYVSPPRFDEYARGARELGFAGVASSPLVRSSYRAGQMRAAVTARPPGQAPTSGEGAGPERGFASSDTGL